MNRIDWPWEKLFTLGPFLGALVMTIIIGVVTGGIAYALDHSSVSFQSASISPDGSTCSIHFFNHGRSASHLSLIVMSVSGTTNSVSFGSSYLIPAGNATYPCQRGSQTQFVPSVVGHQGMPFNLTARFDDGTRVSYRSAFP